MQAYKNIREIIREEVRKEKEKSTKDSLNYVVSKKTVNDGNQPVYREINLLNTQSNNSLRIWVTSEGLFTLQSLAIVPVTVNGKSFLLINRQ